MKSNVNQNSCKSNSHKQQQPLRLSYHTEQFFVVKNFKSLVAFMQNNKSRVVINKLYRATHEIVNIYTAGLSGLQHL